MARRRFKFTLQDYLQMPVTEPWYELIEGELHMVPAPTPLHQRIVLNLAMAIQSIVKEQSLGQVFVSPIDVILSQENVFQPDVVFISRERESIISEENIQGPPDLVVEVLSPSTAERDRGIKRDDYEKYGVIEVCLVDTEARTAEVLRLTEEGLETVRVYPHGTIVQSPLLEGLRLPVVEVFRV